MYCAHAGAAGQTQSRMHTHASRHTRACTPNPKQTPGSGRAGHRKHESRHHTMVGGSHECPRQKTTVRGARARLDLSRDEACRESEKSIAMQSIAVAARRIGGEQRRRARAARRFGQTNSNSSAGCLGQHGMDSRPTASRPRWSARSGARTRRGRPQHTRRGSARRSTGGPARRWRPEHGAAQTAPWEPRG